MVKTMADELEQVFEIKQGAKRLKARWVVVVVANSVYYLFSLIRGAQEHVSMVQYPPSALRSCPRRYASFHINNLRDY